MDAIPDRSVLLPVVALSDFYSVVTFTNRNFGFFAPDVAADWTVKTTLFDAKGRSRPWSFRLPNREMEVRGYSMVGHFAEQSTSMDLFARSWAVHAMNENPDVVRVDIEVTWNVIPSMAEWRAGRRITSDPFYKTTFSLH